MEQMKLESLKARVRRSEYVVDPEAVAEAILRRVVAARAQSSGRRTAGQQGPAAGNLGSDDVLEAG
jgi:hypothetical protein